MLLSILSTYFQNILTHQKLKFNLSKLQKIKQQKKILSLTYLFTVTSVKQILNVYVCPSLTKKLTTHIMVHFCSCQLGLTHTNSYKVNVNVQGSQWFKSLEVYLMCCEGLERCPLKNNVFSLYAVGVVITTITVISIGPITQISSLCCKYSPRQVEMTTIIH